MRETRLNNPPDDLSRVMPLPLISRSDLAFDRLTINPHATKVVIEWIGPTGYGVYLYRSRTGITGTWELLNDLPLPDTGTYEDSPPLESLTDWKWRAMADPNGPPETWVYSEIVGAYDRTTKNEWALAKAIQRRELFHMAGTRGQGLRAFHCKPRKTGLAASNYDPLTGQMIGPQCPDDPQAYGQLYRQGYYPAVETWVWVLQLEGKSKASRKDATGEDQSRNSVFRMVAFPEPERGDLIVLLDSDRRWVLNDKPLGHYLRANLPLFYDTQGLLVEKGDPRHKFPVKDMTYTWTPWAMTIDGQAIEIDGQPTILSP